MWGKVVLYLKEKKFIRLQIACGEIIDVDKQGNNFVINTEDSVIENLLNSEENQKIIKQAFAWQGFYGNLIVNKILTNAEKQASDLDRLKKLGIEFKIDKGE